MLSITRSLVSKAPAARSKASAPKTQKLSVRWNSITTDPKKAQAKQQDWVGTVREKQNEGEEPALDKAMKMNMAQSASKVKGGEEASKRAEEVTKAKSSDASIDPKSKKTSPKSSQSPWSV